VLEGIAEDASIAAAKVWLMKLAGKYGGNKMLVCNFSDKLENTDIMDSIEDILEELDAQVIKQLIIS
jgi:hypothetical protein